MQAEKIARLLSVAKNRKHKPFSRENYQRIDHSSDLAIWFQI